MSGSSRSSSARSSSSSGRTTTACARPSFQGLREDKTAREVHPRGAASVRAPLRASGCFKLTNLDKVFWPEGTDHEGRPAHVLPSDRAGAPAAHPRPAIHDEALPRRRVRARRSSRRTRRRTCRTGSRRSACTCRPARVAAKRRSGSTRAARQRRGRAALDGQHGLHRHEHVVLARRQARSPGLRALRPRPVRRTSASRRRSQVALLVKAGARRARPRVVPEDVERRRHARARAGRAPATPSTTRASSRRSSPARSRARIRGLATTEWSKAKRRGVLIDSNQNGEGKTIASVYSVRPRPGAPVSTPLRWDEVEREARSVGRSRWTSCSSGSREARRPLRGRAVDAAAPRQGAERRCASR